MLLHLKGVKILAVSMQVCMQRLIINGRMRVTLSPLLNEMPIVGAAQISLVSMPDFRLASHWHGSNLRT